MQVAIVTALSVLITLWISRWYEDRRRKADQEHEDKRSQADNQEWYKRNLFEKRLQAVQEGYSWIMKINVGLNTAGSDPQAQPNIELGRVAVEARQWYDLHGLYLYDELPTYSAFVGLTNVAIDKAGGRQGSEFDSFNEAYKFIQNRANQILQG